MCYFILKLALTNCFNLVPFIILETLVLLNLYREASVRYQCFRLMSFSLRYEYQTKVFDLIMTIFIIAHFIVSIHRRRYPSNNSVFGAAFGHPRKSRTKLDDASPNRPRALLHAICLRLLLHDHDNPHRRLRWSASEKPLRSVRDRHGADFRY